MTFILPNAAPILLPFWTGIVGSVRPIGLGILLRLAG